tara:strand:+ start:290 stop:1531 length:1242 start_codon:yes stop_codon:yes gene_type:complete
MAEKPTPKSQLDISSQFVIDRAAPGAQKPPSKQINRGSTRTRKEDRVGDIKIGLYDIDDAIKYYFDEVIRPRVNDFDEDVSVPVLYGSPERWVSAQRGQYYRDQKGKIMVPLIMYRRTSVGKDTSVNFSKIDANNPKLFYTFEKKYSPQNRYDNFSALQGVVPIRERYSVVVPDYVTIQYEGVIWTDYIEQMNDLIEAINYSQGSYWGDPERFKFRTSIAEFSDSTEVPTDGDRIVKTTFNMELHGYIIPDSLNKELAMSNPNTQLENTVGQILFDEGDDIDSSDVIQGTETATGGSNFVTSTPGATVEETLDMSLVFQYLDKRFSKLANNTAMTTNTATFLTSSLAVAPSGFELNATNNNDFLVFVNGAYVRPGLYSVAEESGNTIFTFTTSSLGYDLESDDEIIAYGKFNA